MIFLTFAEMCDALPEDFHWGEPLTPAVFKHIESAIEQAARATPAEQSKLMVWSGSMPESNGKTNFTAILHRGDLSKGYTIDRSEYPDRVRYEADRVRWLIGEIDKEPWILDYDADKHSGYVSPIRALKSQQDAAIESQRSGDGE